MKEVTWRSEEKLRGREGDWPDLRIRKTGELHFQN